MLLWYVGLSVVIVLLVFQSSGVDYRLIAVGSLLPLAIDLPARRLCSAWRADVAALTCLRHSAPLEAA